MQRFVFLVIFTHKHILKARALYKIIKPFVQLPNKCFSVVSFKVLAVKRASDEAIQT